MQPPYKILVADDDDDSRRFAVAVLERAGFDVVASTTGTHALQLARTTVPDVIVLDVDLPDVDGFEVCERLQDEPSTRSPLTRSTTR